MNEYFGDSAKIYQQTDGKKYLLIPAFERALHSLKSKKGTLLDVGCGNGDLYVLAQKFGYKYFGIDISDDMIERARAEFPQGSYLVANSSLFASRVKGKYKVILISMLFPVFQNKNQITQTLKECKKVLKKGGKIIIGVAHPHFDCYMRKGLFDVDFVDTHFDGYFNSGESMYIHKKFEKGTMTFEDFHWTLADYVQCINKAGLKIGDIDECEPTGAPKSIEKKKKNFPTYMVITCQ